MNHSHGYFGALMQSSGLGVGAQATSGMTRALAEPHLIEVELERSSPRALLPPSEVRIETPALTPQRADEPPSFATTTTQPASRPATATPTAESVEHDTPLPAEGTPPNVAAPAAAEDRSGPPSPQMRRDMLVRTAMQWVAADPQNARPSAPQLMGANDVHPVSESAQAPSTLDTPTPPRSPSRPTALALDRPVLPALPVSPVVPPARHEAVEISISTIHVRVDAPPVTTVARPAAPSAVEPGPVRVAAGPSSSRSALSRRALRRI